MISQLREEALQQELYATRLALLKKTTCCNCNQNNNAHAEAADEMVSRLQLLLGPFDEFP